MQHKNELFIKQGAFLQKDGSCLFRTWAPLRHSVSLHIIHPEEKKVELVKEGFGYWSAQVQNIQSGCKYFYVLDDEIERPDIASFSQPLGVHEVSEVVDLNFNWSDEGWKGLPLKEMIIYELHVGTFSGQGTFEGVIKQFDHLHDLGVNTIEIMPVAQFPGNRNWGYDGVYPFAVQNSYGGVKGLQHFVSEAHKKGFAVILDVVYNHLGPEGNYFYDYGPYFSDKYKTPWGSAINFEGEYCGGVRNYFLQNAFMWLHDFHIDGLRMDAVHAIYDSSAKHIMEDISDVTAYAESLSGNKKILIAEFDLNDPRYITNKSKGGYGLDAQWVDEFHHALHALVTGERNGYYEDFGTIGHLKRSFENGYVYTGEYSHGRKRHFGKPLKHYSTDQLIVFTQNHDHIGNRAVGDRLTQSLTTAQLKLVAACMLLSPFTPMLFMGEEYGEKNPFQYFVSHGDENLIEMVREGRKKEFSYFMNGEELPDPYSEETFQHSKLSWKKDEEIYSCYKELIRLRKTNPALQSTSPANLLVHNTSGNVLAIERKSGDHDVLIVFNFEKNEIEYPIGEGTQIIYATEKNIEIKNQSVSVPAFACVVIEKK